MRRSQRLVLHAVQKNSVEKDTNIRALLDAQTPVVTIFGKTWLLHVKQALQISPEQNLTIISDSVAYLKKHGKEVIYDAEHFFDGYKHDKAYAMQTLAAAARLVQKFSSSVIRTAEHCHGK